MGGGDFEMSERQSRLKAEFSMASMICLAWFVGCGVWVIVANVSVESHPGLVALWWASLLVGAGCAIAACRIDESPEDEEHLASVVAGIRDEWHVGSTRGR